MAADTTAHWQEELRGAAKSVEELIKLGYMAREESSALSDAEKKFRVLIPQYYLNLINKNDPNDPIALMALPRAQEMITQTSSLRDPIGDLAHQAAPRLTHRYKNRALLHVTNLCPMYCRFCFRKNLMNEKEEGLYGGDFSEAFSYLRQHEEIHELILTGGDPWMLSDHKLAEIVNSVAEIPSLRIIRFHTRMPVTLPSRVTDELLRVIVQEGRLQTVVVTHFNHPKELSKEARAAAKKIRAAGILLLNQSVLLRGVNDNEETLISLFQELGNAGILPYYLHHCDLVSGAEHFRISVVRGQELWASLRGKLSGYLIPEYILDLPGGGGKVPIGEAFLQEHNHKPESPKEYEFAMQGKTLIYKDIL